MPGGAAALAAIATLRYALGADGVGAARRGACGSQLATSRYALGAELRAEVSTVYAVDAGRR